MLILKTKHFIFFCIFFSIYCNAQNSDTLTIKNLETKKIVTYTTDKFSVLRPLNLDYTYSTPYQYKYKGEFKDAGPNKINHFEHLRLTANMRFFAKNKWMIGTTLGYTNVKFGANISEPYNSQLVNLERTYHEISVAFNALYTTTLFDRRTIFSGSLKVDTSIKHFERIKGLLSGIMVMNNTPRTKLSLGILLNIDPRAQLPILPIVAYEHHLGNNFLIDLTLPKGFFIRKNVFKQARISLGTDIEQISFYLFDTFKDNQTYIFRQIDFNSGVTYEHALGHFILTARTGLKSTYYGRLYEKGQNYSNPLLEISPESRFYFSLGLSINPFTLLGKKKS